MITNSRLEGGNYLFRYYGVECLVPTARNIEGDLVVFFKMDLANSVKAEIEAHIRKTQTVVSITKE